MQNREKKCWGGWVVFNKKKKICSPENQSFRIYAKPNETTERGNKVQRDTVCFISTVAAHTHTLGNQNPSDLTMAGLANMF